MPFFEYNQQKLPLEMPPNKTASKGSSFKKPENINATHPALV